MKAAALSLLLTAALLALAAVPPRAGAGDPDPVVGNVHSKLRVIIYQDLECPDCARWHQVFQSQIIPQFGKQVAFEFRDFPLPQHLWSFNAAVLARFFDTRGLNIGMAWRNYCFTHQDALTPDNLMDTAANWARAYGITRAQLENAFSNPELFALVQADMHRGNQDNVQHTPTVLFAGTEATTPQQLELRLAQAVSNRG